MEESYNSLDGWVAYRPNSFKQDNVGSQRDVILVAWNSVEQVFAVTVTSGHRKASDRQSAAQAACVRYDHTC